MESLPSDIVLDIVFRVPAESVLECKLVCKTWVTLIRTSSFTNMHLSRQLNHLHENDDDSGNDNLSAKGESSLFFACRVDNQDDYPTLLFHGGQLSIDEKYIYSENLKRIYYTPKHRHPLSGHLVGSCNGLVCTFQLQNFMMDPICICNPLTREYVHLPQLVVKKENIHLDFIRITRKQVNMHEHVDLVYVRSTNEYKVVRIQYLGFKQGNVEVYTLGSGCGWRVTGTVSYRVRATLFGGVGTYTNDAIYWVSSKNVVAFDLDDEEFRLLTAPSCMQDIKQKDRYGLVALGRRLCLYPNQAWKSGP
ncbi:F-box protein At3g07870-like [Papaver somniferum]|uniref:F-box protein At3g07870-like n=1 Tax=Papaver somniferum TaxID=3469 RepID=UPI000E6F5251|nr:F-box protein At3g07870-like [Papaver somniferum]XP_026443738.1 F-box protein At3g07870-like [Papaver somniferum]